MAGPFWLDLFQSNGTVYNITRIDTFEGHKEDLTLYCVAKNEITKP